MSSINRIDNACLRLCFSGPPFTRLKLVISITQWSVTSVASFAFNLSALICLARGFEVFRTVVGPGFVINRIPGVKATSAAGNGLVDTFCNLHPGHNSCFTKSPCLEYCLWKLDLLNLSLIQGTNMKVAIRSSSLIWCKWVGNERCA
uniref:Uncharacterized protein n=1 Tax=Wolfiporia cocos TaxID=81056 RepID=A0A7G7YDS4_9APHY|nr:hypothetical protein [Wolfiporia cocos]QNH92644.1 hypothetical protein [Wolfiporia cocos]